MTVTETLNEGLKRGYALVIPNAAIAARVDAAIAEVAPKMRMPGFRPGKVPGNLVRRMHGEALRAEAVREAVKEAVDGLMAERQLRPAMQPAVDLDGEAAEGADIRLTVSMEVLPTVPEADFEGIALERLTVEPGEADIDAALERLAEQQKRFEDAPEGHAATAGDLVVMDYRGTVDGKAFEGGTGEDMEIELGSGRLIPGFEDGLQGVKAGEARDIALTFPTDYPEERLAGADALFAVRVQAVRVPVVPAVDDEMAKNLGLDGLEALREILKDQVDQELRGLTRTYMKRKLLDHLAAAHDFDVPPSMVEAEFGQIWRQATGEASEAEKAELEAERDSYRRIAERRVRLGLLLSDIGQKNGIQVSQAEMNRLIAQEAARFRGQERDVQQYFAENPVAAAQLRAPLFEEKVVDFLLAKASITERPATRAELEAAIESEDETPLAMAGGHVHGPDCDHDHDHEGPPAAKRGGKATKKAVDEGLAQEAGADEGRADEGVADAAAAGAAVMPEGDALAPPEGEVPPARPRRAKKAAAPE
jgi:trigger factor